MDYQELKRQVEAVPASKLKEYKELLSVSCVAKDVWPQLKPHLESASTCDEFFESVYADDACRFENVWALWAKLKRKDWVPRFEPDAAMHDLLLDNRGVFLRGGDNELLIPMVGRGRSVSLYLFSENGFNEKAAELYGSIYGKFDCCGMELDGAYDIYRTDRALIFERWAIDKLMRRANGKGQISSGCSCNKVWDIIQ